MKRMLLLAVGLGFARLVPAQALSPIGLWKNPTGDNAFTFELFTCGDRLCGKFAAVPRDPATGKPLADAKNPDPAQRGRSRLGLVFIQNFTADGENKWNKGKIYNPEDGRTYSALLTMKTPNTLELRGYLGFSLLGQTQTWTRLK